MKKRNVITGFLILCLLALTACGNSGSTGQSSADVNGDPHIELVWAGWTGEEEAFKPTITAMRDSWADKQDNASISFLGWPWANTLEQYIIRSQTKERMDVVQLEAGWLKTLADAGILMDLTEVIDESWLAQNYSQDMLRAGMVDGVQYALPWTAAGMGLSYNPEIFEAAGITEIPTTIKEFDDALQKIKDFDPDILPFAMVTAGPESMAPDIEMWLWTFGGAVFDEEGNVIINNEQGVETLNWIKSLHDRGFIRMNISRGTEARPLFAQGKAAIYDDAILARSITQSNGVAEEELEQRIQPMPRPVLHEGDEPQNRLWGHLLGVVSYTENPDLAADFVKHVVGEEQSVMYFEQNGLPPVTNAAIASEAVQQDEFTSKWLSYNASIRVPTTERYSQKKELDNIVAEEVQAALLDQKSVEQALNDAASRIKSLLNI